MIATLGAPAFAVLVWGVVLLVLALFVYEVYVLVVDSRGRSPPR